MKVLLSLLLLLAGIVAKADTFDFAFTGQNFNASGTIAGELISPGVYQVTAMSGILSQIWLCHRQSRSQPVSCLQAPGSLLWEAG